MSEVDELRRSDFFVSYTANDREFAEWIAWTLEEAGYSVLVQAWEMVPGSNWLRMMNQATQLAERTIALLSAEYLRRSTYGEVEWLAAFQRDPGGVTRRLIPVRIEDCAVGGILAGIVHTDLFDLSEDEMRSTLLTAIRAAISGRAKPTVKPPLPSAHSQTGTLRRHSIYRQQVANIAPPKLFERDREIADLINFCIGPEKEAAKTRYTWWQAGPWAGKSALMATFVLQSAELLREQACVVSFFITTRIAGHATRDAFVSAILAQLVELLPGANPPPPVDDVMREIYLLELIDQAATACRAAGRRLVLVVDGLDEDESTTTGPQARSIAGLLPAKPPEALRVIVAGRRNPPIPDDVESWHPLRESRNIVSLEPSKHAEGLKMRSEKELRRLLQGSSAEQDLLGLVTAARGGLSAPDLRQLSGAELWQVEDILRTVAGRTFARQSIVNSQSEGGETYVLAHAEIRASAATYLGEKRLADYRDRIHFWVTEYRRAGWPTETPQYILTDYFGLLVELDDAPRTLYCATDTDRHNRMLDLLGGDAAALAEVEVALDRVVQQPDPDLASALRLAYHREILIGRNAHIPSNLPALWVRLGRIPRAVALAASITSADEQLKAVSGLFFELRKVCNGEQLLGIAEQLEASIRSYNPIVHDYYYQAGENYRTVRHYAKILICIAEALASAGDLQSAISVALRAADVARQIPEAHYRADALSSICNVLATVDSTDYARVVALEADSAARSIEGSPWGHMSVLRGVVQVLVALDEMEPAIALAHEAVAIARAIHNAKRRVSELCHSAEILTAADLTAEVAALINEAEIVARSIEKADERADALASVSAALAKMGVMDQSIAIAIESETGPRSSDQRTGMFAARRSNQAISALRIAGDIEREEVVARTTVDPTRKAGQFCSLAIRLGRKGEHIRATSLAAEAETIIMSLPQTEQSAGDLALVAHAFAATGARERALGLAVKAEQVARLEGKELDERERASDLEFVARLWEELGNDVRAIEVATDAEACARLSYDPKMRAESLLSVAEALVDADQSDRAAAVLAKLEAIAHSLDDSEQEEEYLAYTASCLAKAGLFERSTELIDQVFDSYWKSCAQLDLVRALAASSQIYEAALLSDSISEFEDKALALLIVANALREAGRTEYAITVAAEASDLTAYIPEPGSSATLTAAHVLEQLGRHSAATDLLVRAASAVKSVADAQWRDERLSSIAVELGRVGEVSSALDLISSISLPGLKDQCLATMAAVLANTTRIEAAEELVELISRTDLKAFGHAFIVKELAATGDSGPAAELALRVADQIESVLSTNDVPFGYQAELLVMAAEALRVTHSWERATGFVKQAEQAIRLATDMNAHDRRDGLADVALAFVALGRVAEGKRVALSIPDPAHQSRILVKMVEELIAAGRLSDARRVAAVACQKAHWSEVVGVLLQVSPDCAEVAFSVCMEN